MVVDILVVMSLTSLSFVLACTSYRVGEGEGRERGGRERGGGREGEERGENREGIGEEIYLQK